MTPIELLEQVKARFPVLLHKEETALMALLTKAVGVYQELAGFMAKARFSEADVVDGVVALPERFSTRVSVKDKTGTFIPSEPWDGNLELTLYGHEQYPLVLTYLENLRDADFNLINLPDNSVVLIGDYLELLIMSPNNERLRRVAIAGKLDTSDIATEADIAQRKSETEEKIKTSQAMLEMVSLF